MTHSSRHLFQVILFSLLISLGLGISSCNEKEDQSIVNTVDLFKEKLSDLAADTKDSLFLIHLESIAQVIDAEKYLSKKETKLLDEMYQSFMKDTLANPSNFESYIDRKRMLILAWVSPTDGAVSFSWLRLPKDWNQEKEYPLYVHLHGHWDVAARPISFMSFTFNEKPTSSPAFEDGYFLSPWGRGNKWYHGISKTDIWECITEFEKIAKVDLNRKYLCGHSMGGYGTWHIAQESAEVWAAIGIHSGALKYNNAKYVTAEYADKLKNIPTYFVWGDQEKQLKIENIKAHKLLQEAGNQNLEINTFNGGHDYNDTDVENMYKWLRNFSKEE